MQTLLLILDLQIPKFASPWLGPRVRMVCLCRLQDVLRSLGSLGTRGLGTRTLKTHEAVTAGLRSFIWPAWRKPMIWNRNSAWKHRKPATSTTLRGLKANTASSKKDRAQKVGTGAEKSLFLALGFVSLWRQTVYNDLVKNNAHCNIHLHYFTWYFVIFHTDF